MWPTPSAEDGESAGMRHSRGVADTLTAMSRATPPAPGDTVNRAHRLKALGNGIVVVCAIPFALAIADVLGLTDAE